MTTKVQTRRIELDGELLEGGAVTYHSDGPFTTEEMPVVNDNKITITQGGVVKGFFNLNQNNDKTIVLESQAAAGGGDMLYSDFNYIEQSGSSITLALCTKINVTGDFTINAPSGDDLKEGQAYYLRVINPDTTDPYTMTLGTNVTNPMLVDLTLTPGFIDIFVFMAVDGKLELQEGVKRLARVAYSGNFEDLVSPFVFIKVSGWKTTASLDYIKGLYDTGVLPILLLQDHGKFAYPYSSPAGSFVWNLLYIDDEDGYVHSAMFTHDDTAVTGGYSISVEDEQTRMSYENVEGLSTVAHTGNFVDIIGKPVILTKAQREALPDTKYTDGTFYFIYK